MDRHNSQVPSVLPYDERKDEQLMVQYAAGDERAFEELYRRYRGRAYGYLSSRVRNPRVADELFQKVFLKLHRSRERYEPQHLFSTWFFTVCRNVVIDELRRLGRTPGETPIEEEHLISESPSMDSSSRPIPAAVLSQLPEKQGEAVRLRYEEELGFEEIATKLNTTSENVRQLVSRGVRRLRTLFGNGNE